MGKASRGKASARVLRARETNDAVERILACTERAEGDLKDIPGGSENVRRLSRGEPAQWSRALVGKYGAESILSVNDYASRNAVVELWRQQGRIAYSLHPEMAASLYRADLRGKLPGGLFERLPHISPMVPLPRPWPFVSNDGTKGLIRAYFLTGRVGRESYCATTDPRTEGLAVMPWVEWEGAEPDGYMDVATPLFILPSTKDPFTLHDVLDLTSTWHNSTAQGNEMTMVRQLLPGLVSIMTYLCCDNRDIQDPPPSATKGRRRPAPVPDEPFYVRVGWHIGPKLHAARTRAQAGRSRDGVSFPTGVEYGPQHRAGHFKTVHHGPQRSLSSARWVDPYWTKRELLEEGEEPTTGIIPVDPQQRDPSSHRDVKLSNLGSKKAKEIREREAQQTREGDWDW
jgi:hypothetical protein